jgi:CheY-like chemotaxis protein
VYTILLIEGDPDARSRAKQAFSTGAPHVRLCIVDGGAAGLAYLAGLGAYADRAAYPIPQLVLLDLDLPDRAAFDVLRWSKAKPPLERIPMIVRTSRAGTGEVEEAQALGATACLSKSGGGLPMPGLAKRKHDRDEPRRTVSLGATRARATEISSRT